MGKSRTILALNGIVMMLIGICFFYFNKQINMAMFPGISENDLALAEMKYKLFFK